MGGVRFVGCSSSHNSSIALESVLSTLSLVFLPTSLPNMPAKKQAARAKLTFQEGQLTAMLKEHIGAVTALKLDVHMDIKQRVCAELVLQMRRCSPRVTAPVLQEAMSDLPIKAQQ
eukprot:1732797-Amphidinium_carterae.1